MATEDYREVHLPAAARAELLLREMTLEEKCDQLTGGWPWLLVRPDGSDADGADELLKRAPGHVAGLSADDPARLARPVGAIQRQYTTRTRLGAGHIAASVTNVGPMAGAAQLGYTNVAHEFAVEPASVEVLLGFNSDDRRLQESFALVGKPRVLAGGERSFRCEAVLDHV